MPYVIIKNYIRYKINIDKPVKKWDYISHRCGDDRILAITKDEDYRETIHPLPPPAGDKGLRNYTRSLNGLPTPAVGGQRPSQAIAGKGNGV
ncbi:MAG: hypothetical protein ABIF11_00505 [Nitrospirota bacterium]